MVTIKIEKSKALSECEYSGFVSFDYNRIILEIVREIPFRKYSPETKTWEIPIDKVDYFQKELEKLNCDFEIDGEVSLLYNKCETTLPNTFHYKTKPFKHQEAGVIRGLNSNKWFLGDEQGLGKTKQIIDIAIARKLLYGYKHCLIICGVNTLKWNWVNEIHIHSDEECWILGQKLIKTGKNAGCIKTGSTNDKFADLKKIDKLPYFIITNIETLRDESIANEISKLCKEREINMIAADEMHKMKNPTSQQTKGFLKCITECQIGMTGTPLMNNPLDLYVILRWLGYESHAFYSFKNHYCVMGGYGGYEVIGYRNMSQLTNQIQEIMLRRLKKDVLDLPEKLYVDEYVEMEGKQAQLYGEVKAGIKTALTNGEIDLNNPLSALIRLRQVTGYPGIISDKVKDSAKLDRMVDIVEEAVANNQKVLIYSNWTKMTDEIYTRLWDKFDVLQITGETLDNIRQKTVDTFQNTDKCNVLVGTIGAMGTGLTLTAATVVIFVDEPWNKALYEQAVDRAHRIGQKNNITIYNLLTKDSIDERIHKIIYKKGKMSDAIIDGHIVGDKSEVINYLLS